MGPPNSGSIFSKVSSFWQEKILPLVQSTASLGDAWVGKDAALAYREGKLSSISGAGGRPIRVAFRNLSQVPLLLCWVSENGDLHHFYKLSPASSLRLFDGDDSASFSHPSFSTVTEGDHVEHTRGGHAFCVAHIPENQIDRAKSLKSLPDLSSIVGGYRPHVNCQSDQIHLVTFSRTAVSEVGGCCSNPPAFLLRKRKRRVAFLLEGDNHDDHIDHSSEWTLNVKIARIDLTPWDTSTKVYELCILGGWPVYAEPNWHGGDKELEQRLANDLKEAGNILPKHAAEYLRQNCPIWVNKSIKYGPKVCPIKGQYCCYHPDRNWLIDNGLNPAKHKCIEINDGPGLTKDVDLWGPGGLMVHELSHAYHHRMLPGGYRNREIIACYKQAMKEGLYDKVRVHGVQGPTAKAYACTNEMEYFAELSTAFLGCEDDSTEFNKWFPFNRAQLKQHDPRAYNLLCRLWKVKPTK